MCIIGGTVKTATKDITVWKVFIKRFKQDGKTKLVTPCYPPSGLTPKQVSKRIAREFDDGYGYCSFPNIASANKWFLCGDSTVKMIIPAGTRYCEGFQDDQPDLPAIRSERLRLAENKPQKDKTNGR